MADVTAARAALAYAQAMGKGPEGAGAKADPGAAFESLLGELASSAIQAGKKAEVQSVQASLGKADVADVVTAVNNAQLTLETVVAVRDRVISAYQEIMRMPI